MFEFGTRKVKEMTLPAWAIILEELQREMESKQQLRSDAEKEKGSRPKK